jgi:hypothetical protein
MGEIEGVHEQRGVPDLPAAAAAHEPPQLVVGVALAPFGLLLERPERPELTLALDDLLDARGAEHADQLVLEIRDAHEESERLHVSTREVGAEACLLERPPDVRLLAGVAQAGQSEVEPVGAEALERGSDRLCASDRDHLDPGGVEVEPATAREGLDGTLVAGPLHEDGRPRGGLRHQ